MYKRLDIYRKYFFYAIYSLLFAALILSLFLRRIDYFFFLLLSLIPIEIFLSPNQIKITDSEVSVSRIHLLGLIGSVKAISFSRIISIDAIAYFEGFGSYEQDGSFLTFPGNGNPPFALYQITYLNTADKTGRLKLKLYPNEFNILKEKLNQSGQPKR